MKVKTSVQSGEEANDFLFNSELSALKIDDYVIYILLVFNW